MYFAVVRKDDRRKLLLRLRIYALFQAQTGSVHKLVLDLTHFNVVLWLSYHHSLWLLFLSLIVLRLRNQVVNVHQIIRKLYGSQHFTITVSFSSLLPSGCLSEVFEEMGVE